MSTLRLVQAGVSPFTGFGDDPATSIKFGIRLTSNRRPNWTGGNPDLSTFRIHNSNDVVTQYHGRGQRELTLRLAFDDLDALEAMDGVVGTLSTLRYLYGLTSKVGGYKETRDRDYLVLPDTLLVSLDDMDTPIGGDPEATATFRRSVGATSYYGFAVYSEEGS